MLDAIATIIMIGAVPPDPSVAVADALKRHDYRLAGVSSFWEGVHAQKSIWRPYGLKCDNLPENAFAYGYFVSDAIGREAFEGYAKQKYFLITYNREMLKSGLLPAAWNCAIDANPSSPF